MPPLVLTAETIKKITTQDDLVLRNLQVTQGYSRLSKAMQRIIGRKNVSWCSFATHASKTAGQALRHEIMPESVRSTVLRMAGFENTFAFLTDVLGDPNEAETKQNTSLLAEALKRVSKLISQGNVMVFAELAWPFSVFTSRFAKSWDYDETALKAFSDEFLKPGSLELGGQIYLMEAFTAYYQARFDTNSKSKAEKILQGNLLIGLHEQTRLQPIIEKALSVPYDILLKGQRSVGSHAERGKKLSRSSARLRDTITKTATQMMMTITLPNRELKLSEDVIPPTGIHRYATDLLSITDEQSLKLVKKFSQGGLDTLSGSAARDWVSLEERMAFVVDFFRSYQQDKRLFNPPFLDNQAAAIEAGYLPAGPL